MLAALGFAVGLGHAAWQLHQSLPLRAEPVPTPLAAPPDRPAPERESGDLSAVAGMHLFGEYRAPAAPVPPPPVDVREAPPGFRLQGVFTSSDAQEAAALIALDTGSAAHRFRPGDRLGADAELVSVALDHVVVRRAGELQRVSLHPGRGGQTLSSGGAQVGVNIARRARQPRGSSAGLVAPEPPRAAVVMARLRRLRAGAG